MRSKPIVLVCALFALGGCGSQDGNEAPAADAKLMMAEHVQPTAETYWQAVQYVSDESGSREIMPQNDAEWKRTAQAARRLAELGEELKQPQYAEGRGADWMAYAEGLVAVSEQAEKAAQSQDPAKVLEVGGTLYNVCSVCHETYMPVPGGMSPTSPASSQPAG